MTAITAYQAKNGKLFTEAKDAEMEDVKQAYLEFLRQFGIQWDSQQAAWLIKTFFLNWDFPEEQGNPFRFARKLKKLQLIYRKREQLPPHDDIPF
jgi:hypothetical protein